MEFIYREHYVVCAAGWALETETGECAYDGGIKCRNLLTFCHIGGTVWYTHLHPALAWTLQSLCKSIYIYIQEKKEDVKESQKEKKNKQQEIG